MPEQRDDEMTREVNTLAAAYVLDALDPVERYLFEEHLATAPEARQEVRELSGAAVLLAQPLTVQPPDRLRGAVLGQLSAVRQLPPLVAEAPSAPAPSAREPLAQTPSAREPSAPEPSAVPAGAPPPPTAGVLDLQAARARRRQRVLAVATSLAVAAALALGAVVVLDHTGPPGPASAIADIVAQPDAHTRQVPVQGGGRATVVWSAGERRAVVTFAGLPAVSADRTYQLWLIGPAGARSQGTFSPNDGSYQKTLSGALSGQSVGVSVEPAGGVTSPSKDAIRLATKLT